jgi:ATP/maltotriose-dependent transcriptional regulator MalT
VIDHADQLVGRVTELELFEQMLDALVEGDSRTLCIVGGPGIGKSRLLAELSARGNERGCLVLSGSASELERDLPFGPFVDAIDDYAAGVDSHRLSRLEDGVRVELARVFPAFAADARDDLKPLQHERYRSHRAVRALLETLATKPLLLVLDDFHWADGASTELAGALMRRPPSGRVMMVLATRPRREQDVFANEVLRSEQDGELVQVVLEPLSLADARALLPDETPAALAATLHEESGGNPFYLEQLARGAASRKTTAAADGDGALGDADIPRAVALALRDELATLDEAVRRVLDGASVAGDPFEPEFAAAAAGVSEDEAVDALDELLAAEFVRPTDVPRRFRFRHPLVRRAVYDASPAGWRLRAHERMAAALAERGAGAAARAPHVERSARQGDSAAIELLREAGDQAAGRAPATAARYYEAALRLLPDNSPAEQRVELLLSRANALMAVRRLHEAHDALESAVELGDALSPVLRARATLSLSAAQRFMGRPRDEDRLLLEARSVLPDGSPEAVAVAIAVSIDAFWRSDFDAMSEWARRSVDEADALGDPPLRAAAHATLALTCSWMSDIDGAMTARDSAAEIVDALTDDQLAERLDAPSSLAAAETYLDRFADAGRHAERALSVSRKTGQGQLLPSIHASLAVCWSLDGRLAQAERLLTDSLEAARLIDDDKGLCWVLLNRSSVMSDLGDVETALADAKESVSLIGTMDEGLITAWARMRLGSATLDAGDPRRAIELMLEAGGGEELPRIAGSWRSICLETVVRARLEAGDVDDARRSVEISEAWATSLRLPLGGSMARLARARLALATDDPVTAEQAARDAIAGADRAGALFCSAIARVVLGAALGAAGDRDAAVRELTRAVEDLDSFGAVRQRKAAEQELRRLGERIHRRTRAGKADATGIESLTERELEIARLVADRLTNRQIAERLFLSKKTIETHMRNLFTKLGVDSRVEVARVIESARR